MMVEMINDDLKKPKLIETGIPGWLQPAKQDSSNLHTEATLEKAFQLLEGGYSVAQICRENEDMPTRHYLYKWLTATPELKERYIQARKTGMELVMDECIDIADGTDEDMLEDVQRSKLRIETRMKYAAKIDPDRFGDKKQVDTTVTIDISEAIRQGQQRVLERQGRLIEHEE